MPPARLVAVLGVAVPEGVVPPVVEVSGEGAAVVGPGAACTEKADSPSTGWPSAETTR